jgi:hypothetical protein
MVLQEPVLLLLQIYRASAAAASAAHGMMQQHLRDGQR